MKKRVIKNQVTYTLTNNKTGKRLTGSKEDFKYALRRFKIRAASIGLAAGIIATPLISNMVEDFKYSQDTKQAIEMAASTDNYLKNMKNNPVLQAVISQEEVAELEALSSAIITYRELDNKRERTYAEEQNYMEACRIICESKGLVIDTYTDAIRGKVAEAYGITSPEEVGKIDIRDYVHSSSATGEEHGARITLPDGTIITQGYLLNPNKSMDSTLASNIIKARALLDARGFSENLPVEKLPIEKIIKTFEAAKDFEENYTVSCKKNGDLKTEKIEKDNEIEQDEDRDF